MKQTFAANLKVILEDANTEWIIFNLNSKDDLHDFMIRQLPVLPPRVIYARDLSDRPWHNAIAKNVAHRLASSNILVNLDCDNFIASAVDVIRVYFTSDIQALHLWSGVFGDGTCGRIAITRDAFYGLGGYNESFHPMGYDDIDLLKRARARGMKVLRIPSASQVSIQHDRVESMKYCSGGAAEWEKYNQENIAASEFNLANNRLVANEGKNWGQAELEIFRGKGKNLHLV